jgi:hypothetical protein
MALDRCPERHEAEDGSVETAGSTASIFESYDMATTKQIYCRNKNKKTSPGTSE